MGKCHPAVVAEESSGPQGWCLQSPLHRPEDSLKEKLVDAKVWAGGLENGSWDAGLAEGASYSVVLSQAQKQLLLLCGSQTFWPKKLKNWMAESLHPLLSCCRAAAPKRPLV